MRKVLQGALLLLVLASLIYAAYVVPSQMLDEIKRQTATYPVTVTENPTVTTYAPTVTDATEPTKATAHVTANEALHVREYPDADSNVLYWLDTGSEVTLSGACVDGWAELEAGGWVNAEYLDREVCHE